MKQILLMIVTLLHAIAHTDTPSQNYLRMLPPVMKVDIATFKAELAKTPLTADERTKLADVARGEKNRVKIKLEARGNKKMRWGLFGKGWLQMLGAAYCAGNTFATIWSGVETAKRDSGNPLYNLHKSHLSDGPTTIITPEYIDNLSKDNSFGNLAAILMHPTLALYRSIYDLRTYFDWAEAHPQYVNFFVPTTLTLLSLWATYHLACASMRDIKAGWNYHAVLEKKMKQLDEIITCLETQRDLL